MSKIKLNNQDGVAILMVMSTIAILTVILATFTFDIKINKLKIYNLQDKAQAKLNAEAGLKLTLAKLRLYQEGRNTIEKDKNLKKMIPANKLEAVITTPFLYPIPLPKDANIIQKSALADFVKNSLIIGGISVSVSPVNGFLNPNNLRETKETIAASIYKDTQDPDEAGGKNQSTPSQFVEKEITQLLEDTIEAEKESNEEFDLIYGNLEPEMLVKELKYFVNDKIVTEDMNVGDVEKIYLSAGKTPKHAPFSSISELYLLEGWNDAIINLVKDKLTVHEVSVIPINEITESQLKYLFPKITPDQSKEFFKHRDGGIDESSPDQEKIEPKPFQSVEEFKNLVVGQLNIVEESEYDSRVEEFDKAGLKLGVAGKLFKVISKGSSGRAEYTITAYIDLPIKPTKQENTVKNNDKANEDGESSESEDGNTNKTTETDDPSKKTELPMELLPPRVIEIRIN